MFALMTAGKNQGGPGSGSTPGMQARAPAGKQEEEACSEQTHQTKHCVDSEQSAESGGRAGR